MVQLPHLVQYALLEKQFLSNFLTFSTLYSFSFKSLITLLASFSLQSCDLERYPLTDLSEDNFWTDDKNAELALTSLYRGSITNGLEYSVSAI